MKIPAITPQDVVDFLTQLWRLHNRGEMATTNSGRLPSGVFAENVRQEAKRAGFAEYKKGQGWTLTDHGWAHIS